MNDIVITLLQREHFDHGFPEVLSVLAPVGLAKMEAVSVWFSRPVSYKTYVALDGQKVVGTASLLIERKFIHRGGLVAHVEDVAVDANYQGQGIGCSLVGRCIDEARQRSCYKVILNCDDELIAFYEKLGFRQFCNLMRYDIGEFRQG